MKALIPLILAGCATVPPAPSTDSSATVASPSELGSASVAMGADLYRRIAAEESGNIATSPLSLMGAMTPVAAGARGETRAAIDDAMRFPSGEVMRPAGVLLRSLAESRDGARVDIANALWLASDLRPNAALVSAAKRELDAEVARVDFQDGEGAAERINRWASDKTEGRVKHVIDPPFPYTRLVVTNAVYLLADWAEPFKAKDTAPADFLTFAGKTVQTPMMRRIGEYRLIEDSEVQMLDLPYRDGRLSMSLILPKKRGALAAIERSLNGDRLAERLAALDAAPFQVVDVRIPKAEFSGSMTLNDPLAAMGMGVAFTRSADLRGIADEALRISRVLQSSFLKIDEKGTEAAAVTAIDIVVVGSRIFRGPTFRADHPFLFVLRDRPTGAILFMGRIADPSAS